MVQKIQKLIILLQPEVPAPSDNGLALKESHSSVVQLFWDQALEFFWGLFQSYLRHAERTLRVDIIRMTWP